METAAGSSDAFAASVVNVFLPQILGRLFLAGAGSKRKSLDSVPCF